MNPKLKKYEAVFVKGELNDDQIARMVKVPVADVAVARAEFCPAPPVLVAAPVEPSAAPLGDEAGEVSAAAVEAPVDAVVADPLVEQVAAIKAELDNHGVIIAAAAVVAAEVAPSHVRLTATMDTIGPDRRRLHLGYRAVYGGEMASWLWVNHRGIVEAYPVKP